MREFINRLTDLKNDLDDLDYKFGEHDFIMTIMSGIYDEFSEILFAMTWKKSIQDIDVTDLINQLIKIDDLRRLNASSNKFLHNEENDGNRKKKKTNRICFNCRRSGHYAIECTNQTVKPKIKVDFH